MALDIDIVVFFCWDVFDSLPSIFIVANKQKLFMSSLLPVLLFQLIMTITLSLWFLLLTVELAHGRWFSPGIPASSTTKTGRHDIAEILLKVVLNTINHIKSNPYCGELYLIQSFVENKYVNDLQKVDHSQKVNDL